MVSQMNIFLKKFIIIKYIMEILDIQGSANLDPRGLIGRIYIGDYSTLLHTNYISCGPHGFRKEDC